jgi:hypothetical protein
MANQDGISDGGVKKRTVRGQWTAQQRRQIVEASLVEGASIKGLVVAFADRCTCPDSVSERQRLPDLAL